MKIKIDSDLHKAFHEAGHIATAILGGARVHYAAIENDGNARTRIEHIQPSTKKTVACGGYSAERILFERQELIDERGNVLTVNDFERQAMHNARRDKFSFYVTEPIDDSGVYPNSPFQPHSDGTWPPESDAPFREFAFGEIIPLISPHWLAIECFADSLVRLGPLDEREVIEIWKDMTFKS